MIQTTFDGQTVYILTESPDWNGRFGATFELVSQWESGLTARESRRPFAATLRSKLRFKLTLEGTEAIQFAAFFRSYQGQPVLVPYWPAATTWANRAQIQTTGGLRVAWVDGWATSALYTTSEPGWPASGDNVAPCLWGRLEKREGTWASASVFEFDVEFTETGSADYALTPSSVAFTAGPSLAGYATAPRLLSVPLDWAGTSESLSVRIQREQLGFGRAPQETIYPQTNYTETDINVLTETATDFWSLLRFFYSYGAGASFWAPVWRSVAVMAAGITSPSTSLSVTSAAGVQAGDYLAFIQGQSVISTARVSSISGTTLTLGSAPGTLSASDTVVSRLVLARFQKPRLSVEHLVGTTTVSTISVSEVPPEYSPASDETLGTTIGLLTTRGYVYELAQTIGGTTTTTRLTSYENNLTLLGNTYTSRKIDHGTIRQSLFIDRDEIELRSEVVAGDPLVKLATAQAEAPVRVTISTVDVSGTTASNASVIFTGDVIGLSVKGYRLTAKIVSAGTVFDRVYPRFRMQVGCNHALFSAGCALLKSDWEFTANVLNPGSPGYPFTFDLFNLARTVGSLPTVTAGWFAGGWAEFGTGANTSRRAIIDNTANISGLMTITLARDPAPFPSAYASVKLYPGCDGSKSTCVNKFGNFVNFGGHPFLPATNPSLVKLSQNIGGGKK